MAQLGQNVPASQAGGAQAGARQQNPATRRPVLKAKEVVEVERTAKEVKIIRRIVVVDAETEKYIRNLCLPCNEEWYEGLYGNDPDCICEQDISVIDEIMLPPDADVSGWL